MLVSTCRLCGNRTTGARVPGGYRLTRCQPCQDGEDAAKLLNPYRAAAVPPGLDGDASMIAAAPSDHGRSACNAGGPMGIVLGPGGDFTTQH